MSGSRESPPGNIAEASGSADTSRHLTLTNTSSSVVTNPISAPDTEASYPDDMRPLQDPEPFHYTVNPRLLDSVSVYHPYYPYTKGHNPMLEFLTTDGGAQYLMVYYACCILADNCMQVDEGRDCKNENGPFLSTKQTLDGRITVPANDILPAGDYFFIIPDSIAETPSTRGEHYAIIPTFDDWRPPTEIPLPWQQVEVPLHPNNVTPSHARDAEPCAISNVYNAVEKAHIIPRSEGRWAKQNNIKRDVRDAAINENKNRDVLENWKNKIPLRKDLHFQWDHGYLTFFPKSLTCTFPKDYRLAIHVTRAGPESSKGYENIHKYQNTLIKNLQGVPAKFLFIRFAWSIYTEHIMTIFRTKSNYLVKYLVPTEHDQYDYNIDTLSKADICMFRSGSSRLYSPRFGPPPPSGKKRPRINEQEDEEYLALDNTEEDGYLSPSETASSSIYDYDWASDEASECEDTDDMSLPAEAPHELDESVPKDDQGKGDNIANDTCDRHYPVKKPRSSISNVSIRDFTGIAFRRAREGSCSSSPSPNQDRTPNLSRSVETVKTDQDTVQERDNGFPLGFHPILLNNQRKAPDTERSIDKDDSFRFFPAY